MIQNSIIRFITCYFSTNLVKVKIVGLRKLDLHSFWNKGSKQLIYAGYKLICV